MTTNFSGKNLTDKEQRSFTSYLRKKLGRLEEHLINIPKDAVHLQAVCEKFPTKAAYKLALELRVEGDRMYVTEDDHTLTEVVDLAVDKLIHQLRGTRDRAQGRARRTRGARRSMKGEASAVADEPEPAGADRSSIFRMLQPLLPAVSDRVRRDLDRMVLSGELAKEQLTPEAVIDSLIIYLYDHFTEQPEDLSFEQWVAQRATFFLRTMARREREVSGWVSLEQEVPAMDPAREVSVMDSEMHSYYQPDDVHTIEDTLEIVGMDAGEERARAETAALRLLSRLDERPTDVDAAAFVRHMLDDHPYDEIAASQERDTEEVERAVTSIIDELRASVPAEG